MRPITLDDLLPLEEFASRRREFFESLNRYLDRYRRIRIGPRVTLLFENRQTLWFRVQDLLRIARLADPELVEEELKIYNRLLPCKNHLQAALLVEITENRFSEDMAFWQSLSGEHLSLHLGKRHYPAHLVTCRPEDRSVGAAHWVWFALDKEAQKVLKDLREAAFFAMNYRAYDHRSPPLGEEVRTSLLEDLILSERDAQEAA